MGGEHHVEHWYVDFNDDSTHEHGSNNHDHGRAKQRPKYQSHEQSNKPTHE
jgi:hypothetical protein